MNEKIKEFINRWQNKGREKQDTQTFWIELLTDVLEIEDATKRIDFEKTVKIKGEDGKDHTKFIDGYIPETKVLIEQKDAKLSLTKAYPMSGTNQKYTPYEQGDRYGRHLNQKEVPRYIIACNFKEIEVHDNNHRGEPPQIIKLEDLEQDYTRLLFLVNNKNKHLEREKKLSVKAGKLVGQIYDVLLKMYKNPDEKKTLESLNILIVRLVFILYAEDAGIFKKQQFLNYMEQFRKNPGAFRRELLTLFNVLDTPKKDRDPYIDEELSEFPYVNGGLFNKNIEITVPTFNEKAINLILDKASAGFDWQGISPTIFGATFESTLNPETRRSGGMHYTSLENIHKVIDPLFLDELKKDLKRIEEISNVGSKVNALRRFIDRLASLNFLDPACGSGNFLTETYLELRRLENKALSIINKGQAMFVDVNLNDPIKVKLDQFFGIEINDFAVAVANTALFISEYQMLKETEAILNRPIDYLPLHTFNGIHEGNALRINWNEILPAHQCNYVMGNPPFVGHPWRSTFQTEDQEYAFEGFNNCTRLDFVCSWYAKAADYIRKTKVLVGFVSTNSIIQGEAVSILGKFFKRKKLEIIFAVESFYWDHEADVFCVIIGFCYEGSIKADKYIYNESGRKKVNYINNYLRETDQIFLKSRSKPPKGYPKMFRGNLANDDKNLILNKEQKEEFIKKYPDSKNLIKRYVGGGDLVNNTIRYCFWLVDKDVSEYRNNSFIKDRIEKVKEFRQNSDSKASQRKAETPMLFDQIRQPDSDYMAIPKTSTSKRRYIPISIVPKEFIASAEVQIIPEISFYLFGVLSSNVHMAWTRVVAGRLGNGYRYTPSIYNNFPFPKLNNKDKQKIENTAKNILEIRKKYPNSSLADLYDPLTMPKDLLEAHRKNDRAVMEAYGWNWRHMSEEDCIAELTKLYQEMT